MQKEPTRPSSVDLDRELVDPLGSAHVAVEIEDQYTAALVRELRDPSTLEGSREDIKIELATVRIFIRDITKEDSQTLDKILNIKSNESIVPPIFKDLIAKAKAENKLTDLTFTEWMAEYAKDEELMNALQWHTWYLEELDNSPEFIEQVQTVKAEFSRGLSDAIDKEVLPPEVYINPAQLEKITIRHASPLSPCIIGTRAYASRDYGLIHLRPKTSDFMLYHELAHHLTEGMQRIGNEGATDLTALTIYNQVHGEGAHNEELTYDDQAASLKIVEELTQGRVGLYEILQVSTGPDRATNTDSFIEKIDTALGYPLLRVIYQEISTLGDTETHIDQEIELEQERLLRESLESMRQLILYEPEDTQPITINDLHQKLEAMIKDPSIDHTILERCVTIVLNMKSIAARL